MALEADQTIRKRISFTWNNLAVRFIILLMCMHLLAEWDTSLEWECMPKTCFLTRWGTKGQVLLQRVSDYLQTKAPMEARAHNTAALMAAPIHRLLAALHHGPCSLLQVIDLQDLKRHWIQLRISIILWLILMREILIGAELCQISKLLIQPLMMTMKVQSYLLPSPPMIFQEISLLRN